MSSIKTGFNFIWGQSDVDAGIEGVRALLRTDDDGTPKVRILGEKCANLVREIKRYRYKRDRLYVSTKPESRGDVHLMATLRYLALHPIRYHSSKPKQVASGAVAAFRSQQKRLKEAAGTSGTSINLGPGR